MDEARDYYVYHIHHATEVDAAGNPLPVYVGKGRGRRISDKRRNANINAMVDAGLTLPAVKVAADLSRPEAYALEIAEIARIGRKDLGLGTLLNLCDGGAGIRNPAAEVRAKKAVHGRSPENLARLAANRTPENMIRLVAHNGSPENLARLAANGRSPENIARLRSPAYAARIAAVHKGKIVSAETRAKMSAAKKGKPRPPGYVSPLKGKPKSALHRAKISAAQAKPERDAKILALAAAGMTQRAIAAKVGISQWGVGLILKRYPRRALPLAA